MDAVLGVSACWKTAPVSPSTLKQRPRPAAKRRSSFVMKCLGPPPLAESHTAASAVADATLFLLLPGVREHYHIDELALK